MGWADGHIVRLTRCRVKGNHYLHLVKALQGERNQTGNNRGGINGWITRQQIYGYLIAVE
jgi:hypothetical protein